MRKTRASNKLTYDFCHMDDMNTSKSRSESGRNNTQPGYKTIGKAHRNKQAHVTTKKPTANNALQKTYTSGF